MTPGQRTLRGCGTDPVTSQTYRWAFDGTRIFAADTSEVSDQEIYWTDDDGALIGKPKGGTGQTWVVAKWTAPSAAPGSSQPSVVLTGLLGPIAGFLGGGR